MIQWDWRVSSFWTWRREIKREGGKSNFTAFHANENEWKMKKIETERRNQLFHCLHHHHHHHTFLRSFAHSLTWQATPSKASEECKPQKHTQSQRHSEKFIFQTDTWLCIVKESVTKSELSPILSASCNNKIKELWKLIDSRDPVYIFMHK